MVKTRSQTRDDDAPAPAPAVAVTEPASKAAYMRAHRALLRANNPAYKLDESRKRQERRKKRRQRHLDDELLSTNDDHLDELERADTSCKTATDEIKDIIGILQAQVDGKRELTVPEIKTLIIEKAPKLLIKLQDSKNCDQLKKNIYEAKKMYYATRANPKTYEWRSAVELVNDIVRLHEYMYGAERTCNPEDFEWVKDTEKVLHFIDTYKKKDKSGRDTKQDYWALNSKKTQITRLSGFTQVLEGFQDAYEKYKDASMTGKVAKEVDLLSEYNKLTPKEEENWVDWHVLVKAVNVKNLTPRERALVSLYTLFPPRRGKDYRRMKIASKGDDVFDKDFNFLVLKGKTPHEFVFNDYKTYKHYGTQRSDIEGNQFLKVLKGSKKVNGKFQIVYKKFSGILKDYIADAKLSVGDVLFPTDKGTVYQSTGAFTDITASAFEKATLQIPGLKKEKRVTANIARHSIITAFYKGGPTSGEKNELATMMGHKAETQAKYNRIKQGGTKTKKK
jgi:hypothetical protein